MTAIGPSVPDSQRTQVIGDLLVDVRAVCFDLGGTLVKIRSNPTTGLIAARLDISLDEARCRVERKAKRQRHNPADLARTLVDDFGRPELFSVIEQLLTTAQRSSQRPPLYPDVVTTLHALRRRGYQVYALSNALGSSAPPEPPVFHRLFDAVVTSYDTGWCKPELEAFNSVRSRTNLEPHQFLHVGDSLRADVNGALAAGWRAALLRRPGAPRSASELPLGVPQLRSLPMLLPLLPAIP
ncbi:HAD family hydrolase [Micromonospora sp. NPDC047467]|uniref:HAD family hydrolase n=1 Tax=Micromonospora sp. NPDC047467 TaxID=3154814 RepID=UPI0033FE299F